MRTIIAGSRYFTNYERLKRTMSTLPWKPTVVISGCAEGADTLGERWAAENDIPVERFPAKWHIYGAAAGPKRNTQMAQVAEALVAFPTYDSVGTRHMIRTAAKY